ncbi:hypothetical protein ISS07_06300 [Candidatus Woesearchaeota archaeon]|nr:hypothetical protein [Candidatus Woesearchaeota archaeon]
MKNSDVKNIGNMTLNNREQVVSLSLNPEIYPLDIAYSAAYAMLDRAFIVFSGNPKQEILVEIRPKEDGQDLEELGRSFNSELINYAVYTIQSKRNKGVKEAIVHRALRPYSEMKETGFQDDDFSKIEKNLAEIEKSALEDPLGISEPWGNTGKKAESCEGSSEGNIISLEKIKK